MAVSQGQFIAAVREGQANGLTNDEVCDKLGMKRGSFTAKLSQENAVLKQTRESLVRVRDRYEEIQDCLNEIIGMEETEEGQVYSQEPADLKLSTVDTAEYVPPALLDVFTETVSNCETAADVIDKLDAKFEKIKTGIYRCRKMKLKSKGGGGATSTRATEANDVLAMLEALED